MKLVQKFKAAFGMFKLHIGTIGALSLVAGAVLLMLSGPKPTPHVEEVDTLPAFISSLMDECGGGKHSPAKRFVLSQQIERVTSKYLEGDNRHAFVALLCLETRMGSVANAVSHAGARGVSQLMPATAKAEAVRCGLGEVRAEDLQDSELNLNIAACHYAKLVADLGPAVAAAAYNSGAASEAVKSLQRLTPPKNLETAGYSATVAVIMARFLTEKGVKK